ncbi:hypothetical protein ES702_00713 [subsurface metagenome]
MAENKIKKLSQNIRTFLRVTIAIFLFITGLHLGSTADISFICSSSMMNFIMLFIGIILTLCIILSELEDE